MRSLAVAFLTITLATRVLPAQAIPVGSTSVRESPDSAFHQFLAFLKSRSVVVIRSDAGRHRIEAKVKGSEESVLFAFEGTADSTAASAQGTKGGMAALIMGLGVVNDWLESQRGPICGRGPGDSLAAAKVALDTVNAGSRFKSVVLRYTRDSTGFRIVTMPAPTSRVTDGMAIVRLGPACQILSVTLTDSA